MEDRHFSSLYPPEVRQKELQQLFSYILAGNVSELLGLPGSGRTVTLGLLAHNRQIREKYLPDRAKDYHFVLVDFTYLKDEPLHQVVKTIFLAIRESLEDRTMDAEAQKVEELFLEYHSEKESTVVFLGLKRVLDYLAHERDLSLVLLFDSFEVYAPYLDHKFFAQITSLRDHMRYKLSFIFSSNRPLASIVDKDQVGMIEHLIAGHTIWLTPRDDPGNDFIRTFLEGQLGKSVPEDIYKKVLELTGGHAKLVKVALEEVLSSTETQSNISDYLKDNIAVTSVLDEIWDSLHADEQSFLKKISNLQEAVSESNHYLQNVGLVTEEGKITIPLLTSYIAMHTVQSENYIYDSSTNDIKKGDASISENFTASEFRLLKYLLSHAGEIISRDALINASWQDQKTTQGVTEQALDQLLYRIRRKIEEDPNNPYHLITLKGRGVRFIP